MGLERCVIGVYTYPGDELIGTFTKLDDINEQYYLFPRDPVSGARNKPESGVIVVIDTPRSRKPFPWRCSSMMQEALESRVSPGDIVYSPAITEKEEMRQQVAKAVHRLWVRRDYDFTIIDYSVFGVQPTAKKTAILSKMRDEREDLRQELYGFRELKFRKSEEFHKREKGEE